MIDDDPIFIRNEMAKERRVLCEVGEGDESRGNWDWQVGRISLEMTARQH